VALASLLTDCLNDLFPELGVPGLAAALVLGDETATAAFGVRSLEDPQPVTPSTVFRIGSTTKPMTGTLVMQLVDEGLLDLDAPIRTYLPRFSLSQPELTDEVTLRRLLTHQSGLPTAAEEYGSRNPDGLERHVYGVVAAAQLLAPPGTFYSYSNLGVDLAGYICEAVTGDTFDALLTERVIRAAGMTRTTLDPLVAMTYPLAQSHRDGDDGSAYVLHEFAENTGHHPSGFVMSTVEDMARFARVHLHDGAVDGYRILSPESSREMRTPQVSLRLIDGTQSGLSFGIRRRGGVEIVSHDGGISGYASHFLLVPERGAAISILYNRLTLVGHMQLHEAAMRIFDELLGLQGGPFRLAPVPPRRERWSALAGAYGGAASGTVEIRVEDEGLVAELDGRRLCLTQVDEDLFAAGEQSFSFVTIGGDSLPRYLLVDTVPFERAGQPATLTPVRLRQDAAESRDKP
jgi:CubicO group peptidase (beta-lactamase class C family)